MHLEPHLQAIQHDLAAAAALGDEALAEAGRRLSEALGATLHLRLLDLLGEAALEIGAQLPSGRLEIRLAGRDPELVVVPEEGPEPAPASSGEEHTGRITLRLPETLKARVEEAAVREGISTNAWLVRTIAQVLDTHRPSVRRGRHRLQGYAQG
ncbi:MAG TPA: toxin-antitoxin system HicB family antitoxin [Gaiellaceae bacterium]|nr:toxin-antitoxin system HicB family antitoxin [Gaiellaceae bacterium]